MSKDLFTALTENELHRLDDFLLSRIDDDTDTENKDEGVLDVSELDGLFTAIVSGPSFVPPSQWLPVVWGDFEPTWNNEQEFKDIFHLMGRHMNGIADTLMEQPENFEPLFLERATDEQTHIIVEEWCQGYMRGVTLALDQWDVGSEEMSALLMPIVAFTTKRGWEALDKMDEVSFRNVQDAITPNVREIHARWLVRRVHERPTAPTTVRHAAPSVGRNDPCPCGSGKKYKKCCLQ